MIDAAKFSSMYTTFWGISTPTCEHFVRKINIGLCERILMPMEKSDSAGRALIAELGFSLFVESRWPSEMGQSIDVIRKKAEESARRRIAAIQDDDIVNLDLSEQQYGEAREIAERLNIFIGSDADISIPRPVFNGCGIVDSSEGDIITGDVLFEVKTVERGFRSADIRQLITYCALNDAKKKYNINRIGLFNPRSGLAFDLDVDSVAHEIAGRSAGDLFNSILQVLSEGGISR